MQKKLIFLLAFMVIIAIFALQNSIEVEIKLWFWSVRTSMVLVLILTFATGAIAGILFSLPKRSKESKQPVPGQKESPPKVMDKVPLEVKDPKQDDEFEDVGN
ncbi:lipopolysaccharide assembly LapA domain-containing protein [Bacteroidota bacterium]